MLAFEGETFIKQVIQVDVDPPLVKNIHVVSEPQEEPNYNNEIDHRPEVSCGVHDYILVRDREHCSTKPSKYMGMKTRHPTCY